MQVSPAALDAHFKRGLRSLYTVHGDEALLAQEAADAIRQMARTQGYTERQVFTVQGAHFKWAEVLQAGQAMSLFADKQLVEVRIPSGKPGKEGSTALQHMAELASQHDGVLWLVSLPKLDFATQKSAWFAALDGSGASVKIDAVDRKALPVWIGERLRREGLSVAPGEEGARSLQFFADRVEGNLLAAHQEIQKLALLHSQPGHAITLPPDAIESSVVNVARFDVFKLTEAVLAGQLRRVQRMLDGLRAEGEAAVLVHFTLSEEVRSLGRVKTAVAQGKPMPLALRENRVWGAREQLYERVLPSLSAKVLGELLATAQATDAIVKGLRQRGLPSEPWAALQHLAMRLSAACAPAKPGQRA